MAENYPRMFDDKIVSIFLQNFKFGYYLINFSFSQNEGSACHAIIITEVKGTCFYLNKNLDEVQNYYFENCLNGRERFFLEFLKRKVN